MSRAIELLCVLALLAAAKADIIDDAQGAWLGTCTGLASYDGEDLVCAPSPGVDTQEYLVVYDGNDYQWYTRTACNTISGTDYCLSTAVGSGTVTATGTSFEAAADVGDHCFFVDVDGDTMYETGVYVLPDFTYGSECPTEFVDPADNTCTVNANDVGEATYSCTLTRQINIPDLSQILGAQGQWVGSCVAQASTDEDDNIACAPSPGVSGQPYSVEFSGLEWYWETDSVCESFDGAEYCLGADYNTIEVTPDGTTFVVEGEGCFWLDADGETMHESGVYTLPDYLFINTCPSEFTDPDENTCTYVGGSGSASYSCTLTRYEGGAASSVGSNGLLVTLLAVAAAAWARLQ